MSLKLGLRNKIRRSRAGGAVPILLDQSFASGATAAYSLRRLKSSATKAVRVREDSGNTETDIGFSGGTLDTTALLNHVGSNNGFVTKWYDQSGNGNDASNSNASNQPQIVSSGTLIKENGQPTLNFSNTKSFDISSVSAAAGSYEVFFVVNQKDKTRELDYLIDSSDGRLIFALNSGRKGNIGYFVNGSWKETSNTINGQQLLTFELIDGTGGTLYRNGGSILNANYSAVSMGNSTRIGSVNGSSFGSNLKANIQEVILYANDKSSNRNDIENNINNHYSIF